MRSNEVRGEADAIQPPASHPFFPKVEETEIRRGEESQRETKIPPNRATKTKGCTKEHGMRRANTFVLAPTRAQEAELRHLGTFCAKLWNEVNYQRRQAYTNYQPIEWYPQIHKKYVPLIGYAMAPQVVRKNNEAWRSFLALKRLEKQGKLPPHIEKVSPPGYWKRDERYELIILCRNDQYHIKGDTLRLPKGLSVRFKGNLRWSGKQCRLEVRYDQIAERWRVFQPMVVKPVLSPKGSKTCHIDLGVRNLGTVLVEGWTKPIAFNAGDLLADWWYWTRRIAAHQARLWRVNRRKTSKTLERLYRKRQRRFKHAVYAFARQLIKELHDLGVSRIVLGDLNSIRLSGEEQSRQANTMIHNFWSHRRLAQRIRCTAEEHGIAVVEVSEAHTSDTCPRCRSRNSERRGRLFRCLSCGLEAHRDAVGVTNMASLSGERAVGAMAHPMLLRWDGCGWKPSRAMTTQARMNHEKQESPKFIRGECQSHLAGMSSAEVAVQAFKKLDEGDFRTLAAIESCMRTFEYAPAEEIARVSSLFLDRTTYYLRRLHGFGLVVRWAGTYVGYALNYAGYDVLAINALVKAGLLEAFGKPLGVGKEADVYDALTPDGSRIAVKFLRLGRISFRQTRRKRGYLAEDKKVSWLHQSSLAAEREFEALERVHKVGVRVPEPIGRNRHVIAMGMIDGTKLADYAHLRGPKRILKEILLNVKRVYSKAGIVHGDLSEYNVVLESTGHILIIDWPQYVEKSHPSAERLLARDVKTIVGFFTRKFGVRQGVEEALTYVKGVHRAAKTSIRA